MALLLREAPIGSYVRFVDFDTYGMNVYKILESGNRGELTNFAGFPPFVICAKVASFSPDSPDYDILAPGKYSFYSNSRVVLVQ